MWKQKGLNDHNIRKYGGRVLNAVITIELMNVKKAPPQNSGSAFTLWLKRTNICYLIYYLGNETIYVPRKHVNAKTDKSVYSLQKK